MSWFHHASQGSGQQGQYPFGGHRLSATDASCSGFDPCAGGPTLGSSAVGKQHCSTPSLQELPSVTADSPPSLEKLSGFSPNAGRVRDSGPISYLSLQEQRCVLSWFNGWNASQRERFFQDLLGKAVPGKVCTLLDSLSTLQVPPAFALFRIGSVEPGITWVFLLSRLRTNYPISLNASCACGPSGLNPGGRMRGTISCTCWRSRIRASSTTSTGA